MWYGMGCSIYDSFVQQYSGGIDVYIDKRSRKEVSLAHRIETRMSETVEKNGGGGSGGAEDIEEKMALLQFLVELQKKDPEALQEMLKSLGMEKLAPLFGIKQDNKDSSVSSSSPSAAGAGLESMDDLMSAIKQLRSTTDEDRPGTANDLLNALKLKKEAPAKGIEIHPEAGFSYKTTRLSDGKKVFVNMTVHESIEKPSIKKKLDPNTGEEVEGMNIPMSVGVVREEKDKKGEACNVYDIVVHPDVINESDNDPTGKLCKRHA